jgi:hypothetical protein
VSTLVLPYTAVANQVAPSASYNANDAAIVAWANGNIDNTNIGSAGIFASQIKPLTAAEATFGATATGVGYKFLANDITAVPLTVSGVSGQTADLFDVTLTSGGTKALAIASTGVATFASTTQSANGYGSASSSYGPTSCSVNGFIIANAQIIGNAGLFAAGATAVTSGQVAINESGGAMFLDAYTAAGTVFTFRDNVSVTTIATIAAGSGTYTAASDARLKQNVTDLGLGLAEVLRLRPVAFNWIRDNTPSQGFLAQDVAAIIPLAVSICDAKSQMFGISDSHLTPVIVKAIQQLDAKVEAYITAHP